jgi:hypothetical protein
MCPARCFCPDGVGINRLAKRLLVVKERSKLPRPRRMLELAQRLGLDLPDALAGQRFSRP